MIGLSRGAWHYRRHPRPGVPAPINQSERTYPVCINARDRAQITDHITAGWRQGHSVDHSFAMAWDEGVMLASRRSWWRIAATIKDQTQRPIAPTRQSQRARNGTIAPAPVLTATGPGQVWSWDITDLRSPWRGVAFKAYSIIDIYSRKLVGWRVEEREVDALATQMFQQAFDQHGIPAAVHADSGPAMRSNVLAQLFADNNVAKTHNRPRVSNDNPFSESEFRTMKYRPSYPGIFDTLETARAWVQDYVPWYNSRHHHSGIALFTPDQVHDGRWQQLWKTRDETNEAYYNRHPERFKDRPRTPAPAPLVGINLPNQPPTELEGDRLQAA